MTKNPQSEIKSSAKNIGETFKPFLTNGVPLYLLRGVSKQDLDALYVMAYNLYSEKKYQRAFQIFQAIALYNHFDKRGWMGSAACCQLLGNYRAAVSCYAYASLIDAEDPVPLFHAIECYIALKSYDEAHSALGAMLLLAEKNSKFAQLKNWATKMKEALLLRNS